MIQTTRELANAVLLGDRFGRGLSIEAHVFAYPAAFLPAMRPKTAPAIRPVPLA
jgi:hypothetical protein